MRTGQKKDDEKCVKTIRDYRNDARSAAVAFRRSVRNIFETEPLGETCGLKRNGEGWKNCGQNDECSGEALKG